MARNTPLKFMGNLSARLKGRKPPAFGWFSGFGGRKVPPHSHGSQDVQETSQAPTIETQQDSMPKALQNLANIAASMVENKATTPDAVESQDPLLTASPMAKKLKFGKNKTNKRYGI